MLKSIHVAWIQTRLTCKLYTEILQCLQLARLIFSINIPIFHDFSALFSHNYFSKRFIYNVCTKLPNFSVFS